MTIDELRKKKNDMEKKIFDVIKEFENETEMQVLSVGCMALYGGCGMQGRTQQVTTEIKL